jgi:hypothetical protein
VLPKTEFKVVAKFSMATRTKFASVGLLATSIFIDFGLKKNNKKYSGAPKSKMAAQFKMAANI